MNYETGSAQYDPGIDAEFEHMHIFGDRVEPINSTVIKCDIIRDELKVAFVQPSDDQDSPPGYQDSPPGAMFQHIHSTVEENGISDLLDENDYDDRYADDDVIIRHLRPDDDVIIRHSRPDDASSTHQLDIDDAYDEELNEDEAKYEDLIGGVTECDDIRVDVDIVMLSGLAADPNPASGLAAESNPAWVVDFSDVCQSKKPPTGL